MIKCISFDLDDTLWAVEPVVRRANQVLFDWLAEHAPATTETFALHDLPALREQVIKEIPEIGYSVTKVRQQQLRLIFQQSGYSAQESALLVPQAFEVFLAARQQVSFFEGALEVLQQLKEQGYRLGALSNGNADIHRVGLGELMSFQLSADQAGVEKPHPDIFHQMLRQQKLRPEQVIHVGDNPDHDVQGARNAGVWSIWLNLQAQSHQHSPADEQITELDQLPDAVRRIETLAGFRTTL